MKSLLLAFLLCVLVGCASTSGGGGYVVGNGFAPDNTGTQGADQKCENGQGPGCKKK